MISAMSAHRSQEDRKEVLPMVENQKNFEEMFSIIYDNRNRKMATKGSVVDNCRRIEFVK